MIQGVAEFLPISSSGHLVVMKGILSIQEVPLAFDVLLHIPTLLAIILIFRKRIGAILCSLVRLITRQQKESDRENLILIRLIILGSIPTALLGLAIKKIMDAFETATGGSLFEKYPWIVSILFLCTAGILILSKFYSGNKDYKQFGTKGGILVGLAQGIGVLPGISRSGITIASGVLTGLDREKAGEFSFLLSIPAILGATLLEIRDIETIQVTPIALSAGLLTSFIVGLISLSILMKIIRKGRLYLFSFYLIPIGLVTLLIFLLS